MSGEKDSLTDADVKQISALIESLEKSTLDFLQIDSGGMKVTISKGSAAPLALPSAPAATVAASQIPASPRQPETSVAAGSAAGKAPRTQPPQDGTVEINAPLLGRFYSKPDPASPPFVTVGAHVDEDTPVGLIEVMKLFNTVQAGLKGTIVEVCVPDGEFIEFGTALFRVRPD